MRLHRWIVALVSRLVPRDARTEWRAEWDAELHHRESTSREWRTPHRARIDLLRRSSGAVWDALWLQSSRWHSARLFARHWRLALAAVLSLSLAIAATAMGLSAYNALLVRPPAVTDPDSLQLIHIRTEDEPFGAASVPEFTAFRTATRAFADVAAFPHSISSLAFTMGDRREQILGTHVSNNFFSVLGIQAARGILVFRGSPSDIDEIVVGDALWRKLGARADLIGATVRLNDHPVTIVGVVPAAFRGMTWGFDPDVWMSLRTSQRVFGSPLSQLEDWQLRTLHLIGRLKPDVTRAQAASDVQLAAAAIERSRPDVQRGRSAAVTPVSVTPPGDRGWLAGILGALMLIVLLTLVVACANVTNLLLGLSASRRHEMLVRAALGASRLQLVVPVLKESLWLGLASGALGYGAAWLTLARLAQFKPSLGEFLPSLSLDLRPDGYVLAATIAVALSAGLGVGLAPALRCASDGLSGALNREIIIGGIRKARIRHLLVAVQMAIATVVLVGLGIAVHSLFNLKHASLGFSARELVFAGVDMRRSGFDARTGPAFYERMRERLLATPGIQAVALASDPPLLGYPEDRVVAEGEPPPADGHGAPTSYAVVDDRYFSTLGISLLAGRTFDARDRAGRTEVIVVNATLARRYWPGGDPLGRRLRIENGNRLVEVIGVVPDGKYGDINEDPRPFMYFALAQHYLPDITVIARTSGPRDSIALALQAMHPAVVFGGIGSALALDEVLRLSLLLPQTIVWTTMVFCVLAVALAVFGLYSTVFYAVTQRRAEIGIRTTLGAAPSDIFALVFKESGRVALLGGFIGLGAGLALLPFASSIFYGIGAVEPGILTVVALVSTGIVLTTTYLVVRPWTRLTAHDLLRR